MREVAKLPVKDRTELFQATAIKMGMLPNVVEKDFWVCFMHCKKKCISLL